MLDASPPTMHELVTGHGVGEEAADGSGPAGRMRSAACRRAGVPGVPGQLNRSRVISASCGLPSCTSDSCAPTSSKAKPYALPSTICAWMKRE